MRLYTCVAMSGDDSKMHVVLRCPSHHDGEFVAGDELTSIGTTDP